MPGGILNIAHRGASAEKPENTLRSFWRAAEVGADMVACDVRRSADGRLVVVHDPEVVLPDGRRLPVAKLDYDILRTVDAGEGERIPTLEEVLSLVRSVAGVAVELKVPGIEMEAVRLLRAQKTSGPVLIASFLPGVTRRLARIAPEIATSLIIGPDDRRSPAAWFREKNPGLARRRAKADGLFIHTRRLDPALHRKLKDEGVPVAVWTVDDPTEMRLLLAVGVDAIVTNRPEVLAGMLAEWKADS